MLLSTSVSLKPYIISYSLPNNLNEEKFDRNLDIVVIARNSAKDRSYQEIESAFMNLAQKHAIAGGTDEETSY